MNHRRSKALLLISSLLLLGLSQPAIGAEGISAEARFQPEVVAVSQRTNYQVVLYNLSEVPQIWRPECEGLQISEPPSAAWGNGSQVVINGKMISNDRPLILSWSVVADREGSFTIEAKRIEVSGQSIVIPEATLRVVPLSEAERNALRLVWELPDRDLFVGEVIQAELKIYVRSGVTVERARNASLEKVGDGFTIKAFEEFKQGPRETVDGITYEVFAARGVVTPIRPGKLSLKAVLPIVYSDPYNTRVTTDSFGFRRQVMQRRDLSTEDQEFTILEAPTEGQLPGYNGAMGEFEVTALLGTTSARTGEPVSLTLSLSGEGNFDRVSAPEITDSDDWRVYPPKVSFNDKGELGIVGTKEFEFLLIPRSEKVTATPEIPWAAFDPATQTYENLTVAPKAITVAPAPAGDSQATIYARAEAPSNAENTPQDLRPNRADLGPTSKHIVPVFLEPLFLGSQGALALAFLGIFAWQKRRHRFTHDERYARQIVGTKSVRNWARKAQNAAAEGDAAAFFEAAQRALQESVGRRFPRSRRAESLTASEIDEVLIKARLPDSTREVVAGLFRAGDALRYAGGEAYSTDALKKHADDLTDALRELHKGLSR